MKFYQFAVMATVLFLMVGCSENKTDNDPDASPKDSGDICPPMEEELCCCDGDHVTNPVCDLVAKKWTCGDPQHVRMGLCKVIDRVCELREPSPCDGLPGPCCCDEGIFDLPNCDADAGVWYCVEGDEISCEGGGTCFPWR